MRKNLYLLVFIVAGSAEEACAEDRRCCAVLPPTLSVLDEAPGSGEAALSSTGLPGLQQGCGGCEGDQGRGHLGLWKERVTHLSARMQLPGWGCVKSPGRG